MSIPLIAGWVRVDGTISPHVKRDDPVFYGKFFE
jgi:hypothetical protein